MFSLQVNDQVFMLRQWYVESSTLPLACCYKLYIVIIICCIRNTNTTDGLLVILENDSIVEFFNSQHEDVDVKGYMHTKQS